jgi:hypothetical protein
MGKTQIGELMVSDDLLYAYLQSVEDVGEGVDVWRLDTERATNHHKLVKSLGLIEGCKIGRRDYFVNRKKYREFAASLSTWIEKQIEKDRRTLDGNFRQ